MTEATHNRAGRWEQAGNFKAFLPAPLPPDPPLQLDDELQNLLSTADRVMGRLDGSIQTLPNPDHFVFMYVRREAVLSSQIEGTQSSLSDLLEAEAQILDSNRPRDVGEVINYVRAMRVGLERLKTLPLSVRLIRELHRTLLEGVRGADRQPGELRRIQNWIGSREAGPEAAVFVPPPPQYVAQALSDLEKFLHREKHIPVLMEIGLAHAQFETIHPFIDGNGRIGRLLIVFLLCERGILQKPAFYISHYLRRHRADYYDRLQKIREEGDWEGWMRFFLTAVIESAREAVETAREIVALREENRRRIVSRFGRVAANALVVLEHLFEQPLMNVKAVAELTVISYPAANQLVERLVEEGLLREVTGQARNRVYRYEPYVALFQKGTENRR